MIDEHKKYHGLSPLLGHGLLTEMSYRDWKMQRRTILPAFSPTNIRNQIPILQKKLRVLLDKLAQKAETSEYVRPKCCFYAKQLIIPVNRLILTLGSFV
jgi:cytochrome P450